MRTPFFTTCFARLTSLPTVFVVVGLLIAQPGQAEIFRCKDATGAVTFTDHGCARREQSDPIVLRESNRVEGLAPSSAELRQLEALTERFERTVDQRSRSTQAHAKRAARELERADERCQTATQALDELLEQRRSGYRLQQAQSLRQRKAQLKQDKLRYC